MHVSSLGALQHYKLSSKTLAADTLGKKTDAGQAIGQSLKEFSDVFKKVDDAVNSHAIGQADAHSVVEAMANAEMALETAVTIRNRVVEAYQELLRMPV